MNLRDCVTVLGIAVELRTDVRAAARRVLKMADGAAKPYVRLFLVSTNPAEVVRVALREFEPCNKHSEPTTTDAALTVMAASSGLRATLPHAVAPS